MKECGRGGSIKKELLNLKRLKALKNVPVHVDLICGLPREDLNSIKRSVNETYFLSDELQIGFLKLLSGTKIADSAERYGIKYRSYPPYEVLCTSTLSFDDIYLLKGIAHTVDRVSNSGNFRLALDFLLETASSESEDNEGKDRKERARVSPFDFFASLSRSLGGSPAAYSQAAIYEAVYLEGLKYIGDTDDKKVFLELCREDFRRCERTRMPPVLTKGNVF